MKVVISGSFRKYFKDITEAVQKLQEKGMHVLAPHISRIINPGKDFALLETDSKSKSPYEIELNFMGEIVKADFLYVINPENYIGESVSAEISHAKLHKIPVIYSHTDMPLADLNKELISEMIQSTQKELTQEEKEIYTNLRDSLLEKLKHIHV